MKFIFNSHQIQNDLTVAEIGLTHKANITIIKDDNEDDNEAKISLTFSSLEGIIYNIIVYKRIPIGIVLIIYLLRRQKLYQLIDLINGENNIAFIFNAFPLKVKDKRKVGEIFGNIKNPNILVSDMHNLKGG